MELTYVKKIHFHLTFFLNLAYINTFLKFFSFNIHLTFPYIHLTLLFFHLTNILFI
jgi:hypothetical protein